MEFLAIYFIIFLLINIIHAETIEEHVIDPDGADQVPWLVFIAKCLEGRLSFG